LINMHRGAGINIEIGQPHGNLCDARSVECVGARRVCAVIGSFRAVVSWLLLWSAACGGNPTAPGTPAGDASDPLYVRAGLQRLSIYGYGLSNDPDFPPCTPLGIPRSGTIVIATLVLAKEGSEWVARSIPTGDGDLAIHFRSNGGQSNLRPVLTGTAVGSQRHTGDAFTPPQDVRLVVDGIATLEGVSDISFFTYGKMTGNFRFADALGNASTCTVVQWTIQPVNLQAESRSMN
jgi:hypothetical protein